VTKDKDEDFCWIECLTTASKKKASRVETTVRPTIRCRVRGFMAYVVIAREVYYELSCKGVEERSRRTGDKKESQEFTTKGVTVIRVMNAAVENTKQAKQILKQFLA